MKTSLFLAMLLCGSSAVAQSVTQNAPSQILPTGTPSKVVRVNANKSILIALPEDAKRQGVMYRPLNVVEERLVSAVAKAIVSDPRPSKLLDAEKLDKLSGVHVSETLPNGMQRIHHGNGSIYSLPTLDKDCTFGQPISLARLVAEQRYAFVRVTCSTVEPMFMDFLVGVELSGEHVVGVALNSGDRLNLFPPRVGSKPRSSN